MPFPGGTPGLLSSCIRYGRNESTLKLNHERKCHLLNEQGLCKVVLTYGEEKIPQTCHIFPREELLFSNRTELALSPACPYVLDLLWNKKEFRLVQESDDEDVGIHQNEESERAAFAVRDWFLKLMKEKKAAPGDMLRVLFCILKDMREIIGPKEDLFTADFAEQYKMATNIEDVFRTLTARAEGTREEIDRFRENNELFLDIVNRYVNQKKYWNFLEKIVSDAEQMSRENYKNAEAVILLKQKCDQEWEEKLRLLIWEEIGSSLVTDCSLESMLVKLQWIVLLYVVLKQAIFLRWQEKKSLSYELCRETTVIINRIMGYTDQDIRQFLKTEFESLIWPIDYVFLVT